jgi:serine protease
MRVGVFAYILVLLFNINAEAATVLTASLQMASMPGADRHAILIEVKNPTILQTLKLPTNEKFKVEPTFSNDIIQKLKTWNPTTLVENYYYILFENSLDATQGVATLKYLNSLPLVKRAYFEPTIGDPLAYPIVLPPAKKKSGFDEFTVTLVPNYEAQQNYLEAAPKGVDARYAWTLPGGNGAGIRFADVETGWYTEHREFNKAFYDNGKNARKDHGTAVWGIIAAKPDGEGTTGIANGVDFATCATGADSGGDYYTLLSRAIAEATAQLRPGDVLLVEQHQAGPDNGAYAPVEFSDSVFELLKVTTARGVHCIEAAGNGSSNLDSPAYNGAFDRKVRDSGCIIVGAGGSPDGATPYQRLSFSDYGSRVDVFAYGEMVTTTGYGDLFGDQDTTSSYTSQFNGTSSATPMVAAVVASLAGMAKAKNQVLTPAMVRDALHETGTPQAGDTSENIGHMPDLRALANKLIH